MTRRTNFLTLLCIFFVLTGCAGPRLSTPATPRRCDEAIDAAVETGDWNKALVGHQQLLAKSPDNCLAMYHTGYIWGQLRDRQREINYYRKALACGYNDDDRLYFNLGMALVDTGDLENASQMFQSALAINPRGADSYFGLGMIAQAKGDSRAAEDAWLKSISVDPHHREARLSLALFYMDQSRWQEAHRQLEAILKDDSKDEEARELLQELQSRQRLEY